MLVPV
ncbi:hypothetical protein LINPERPRIM_LOCUS1318 [Linum perenne]